ncbi:metallophosphoesterase family protein [Bradyrhizobium brasilense]|uniref:metallophosphoesterase family protein n=1 Tax=Bradyrhizobium brasilense TaxID=1419277 RepID=UPI001E521E03|nr:MULTISPECIES: metallophosphoesterase family protein [Bradyrhizobium]MCC8945700.1 metallophosphoesterase family protein [Bradyrhizobium brasilense]WFU35743.1 metallophosphoesterase family protein [Bradyrhizobium australafricanum]
MLLGVLSDAHGNVEAFQLGLNLLAEAGVDAVYFLGDAVGYIPDAGVVSLLRQGEIRSIRGNHDDMLVRRSATADLDKVYRHSETFAKLSDDERDFLMTLPSQLRLSRPGTDILFVHGSPSDPLAGYVYPDTSLTDFMNVNADVVFMGHTHHPFVRRQDEKLFVNVGSCGLPRGQDLRGTVCIFNVDQRDVEIIRYDISACCERVLSRHLLSSSVAALLDRCSQPMTGEQA